MSGDVCDVYVSRIWGCPEMEIDPQISSNFSDFSLILLPRYAKRLLQKLGLETARRKS